MSGKVVFETATIADALTKAARIAPSIKEIGSNDSSLVPGIKIECNETQNEVYICSTDLDLRYSQKVTPLEISTDDVEWRVPAEVAKYIDTLPKSRGATVELSVSEGRLQIVRAHRAGESRGEYPLIASGLFPFWSPYDETNATVVGSLASKLESVSWACGDEDAHPEMGGVYLDGYYAWATNRYVACQIPVDIPALVGNPITIPVNKLIGIIRQAGDSLVTGIPSGLGITPDDFTQIEVTRFASNKFGQMKDRLPDNTKFNCGVHVNVEQFKEVHDRITRSLKKSDSTSITLMVSSDTMAFSVGNGLSGKISDAIAITNGPQLPTIMTFNGENLGNAIGKSIGQTAVFCFNQGEAKQPVHPYVMGGSGYEAWVSPILGGNEGA
ncbi:DNA polymerase III sliding clamp beta [Gordonia phage Camerico]|nr:DNA polymerase III sliding clamp beta [Gordonia phage Camerico]